MTTLVAFLSTLVASAVDLVRIFLFDVLLSDPLAAVSWLVGAVLTGGAMLVLGGLALGALAEALGLLSQPHSWPPGRRGG